MKREDRSVFGESGEERQKESGGKGRSREGLAE